MNDTDAPRHTRVQRPQVAVRRLRPADVAGGVSGEVLSFDLTGTDGYLADVQYADSFRYARR